MENLTRRNFLVAAGSAAAFSLAPAPVRGLAVPPVEAEKCAFEWRANIIYVPETRITVEEIYLRYQGKQYLHTRFLTSGGKTLDERVRLLRPYEEVTVMRFAKKVK